MKLYSDWEVQYYWFTAGSDTRLILANTYPQTILKGLFSFCISKEEPIAKSLYSKSWFSEVPRKSMLEIAKWGKRGQAVSLADIPSCSRSVNIFKHPYQNSMIIYKMTHNTLIIYNIHYKLTFNTMLIFKIVQRL